MTYAIARPNRQLALGLLLFGLASTALAQVPSNGLDLWLRADQGVITNSGHVAQWLDQSANGYAITATSPAFAPELVPSAVGGQSAIRFDGIDDFLAGGDILDDVFAGDDARFTIFAVTGDIADPTPSDGSAAVLLNKSSATDDQRGMGLALFEEKLYMFTSFSTGLGQFRSALSADSVTAGPRILQAAYDGTLDTNNGNDRFAFFIDGDAQSLTHPFTSGPLGAIPDNMAQLAIGASSNVAGTGGVSHLEGDVAEILVYGRLLSNAEQQQVEDYLQEKYGNVPDYALTVTPTGPLTVPPGGQLSFAYTIANNTASPASGDFYFVARRGGTPVAQAVVLSGTLPGGQTLQASTTINVPNAAPPGNYALTFSIGSAFALAVDSETFTVTVAGAVTRGSGSEGWSVASASPWVPVGPVVASALPPGSLSVPYPNPVRERATLSFALPEAGPVRLAVFDVLGREVAVLVDATREAGEHEAVFEAASLPSGTYLVRLETGGTAQTQHLTLVR